uniref:Uncharacterized protein n=1 Tax=Alexandrium monilatum TaxID=311494 RepID=A0A7S4PSU2_9DINO
MMSTPPAATGSHKRWVLGGSCKGHSVGTRPARQKSPSLSSRRSGRRRAPRQRLLLLAAAPALAVVAAFSSASEAFGLGLPSWLGSRRGRQEATNGNQAISQETETAGAPPTSEDSGRVVRLVAERVQQSVLTGATVEWMDTLMKEEAVDILAAGAERSERAPGGPGTDLWYAFMKPTRMGPWTNQMRLKCQIRLEPSRAVHVDVVGFDVGMIDDKSGEMVFTSYAEDSFSLKWKNSISWRRQGGDLHVSHASYGTVRVVLPWWFPLPDSLVKATMSAGTQYMLRDGQAKISAAITDRHAAG